MRPVDVFGAGLLASVVAGALCSLGLLLLGAESEVVGARSLLGLLGVWVGIGVWAGLAAGLVLGIVPAAIAMNAWPGLVRSVGEARAVRRLTGLVTAIAGAELLVATVGVGVMGPPASPVLLAMVAACGAVAWVHLVGARRIARRRVQRMGRGPA